MADDTLFILELDGQAVVKLPKIIDTTLATDLVQNVGNFNGGSKLWVSAALPYPNHENTPYSFYTSSVWYRPFLGNTHHYVGLTLADARPAALDGTNKPHKPRHASETTYGYSIISDSLGATLPVSFDLYAYLQEDGKRIARVLDGAIDEWLHADSYVVKPNYDTSIKNKVITIT